MTDETRERVVHDWTDVDVDVDVDDAIVQGLPSANGTDLGHLRSRQVSSP